MVRCGVGWLALVAASAAAQETPPTFHGGTKLVEVDVLAKSKGAPAAGLTKDDFRLLDNAKPRKIAFFSVRSAPVAPASGLAAAPLPPGSVSNRVTREDGPLTHITVFLLDQQNTAPDIQAFAIQRVAKFIQGSHSRDRMGIYTLHLNGELHVDEEITDDNELRNRAASRLKPRDSNRRSADTQGMTEHAADDFKLLTLMERAMDFKRAVQEIARHLAGVPGRKNLIWVTTAFPLTGPGVDFTKDMEQVARSLNDANVALYAVDARGLIGALSGMTAISAAETPGPPGSLPTLGRVMGRGEAANPPGLATIQLLAGLTGGLVFFNKSNAIEDSIQTAVEDGDLTYTLGFYPAEDDQDATWHHLKVSVAKRGVSLRFRESYFAARAGDGAPERPTLDQLLKNPLDATEIELVGRSARDPARPGFLQVSVNVDLRGVQMEQRDGRRSGAIDVSFFVEGTGKVVTKNIRLEIPESEFAGYIEKGVDAVESVDAAGGVEALRVVVRDRANGAAGSVTIPLRGK